MLEQSIRLFFRLNSRPFHLVAACGIGLLLGIACLLFSPLWTLAAFAGGGLAFAALKRPEIPLLGILVATSSIVFEETLPLIPVGVGSLHISDVLLLASLGLIVLRWLVEPDFKIVRTPLDWPLLLFYGVALLSTFIAVLRSSVEFYVAIRAIRVVTYYLTFFVVTNLVRADRQLRFLVSGFSLLATIVAAAMVAQFLLGESVPILPGRVESLRTQDKIYGGIARILPPGQSLVLVAFINITVVLVLNEFKLIDLWRFFQWGLLGLALVLTFNRYYWVTTGLALLILAYLIRGKDKQRLIWLGLVSLFLAAIVLLPALARPESRGAQLVAASLTRVGTLMSSETLEESSLQWRYVESEYALPQIASYPFAGLGLGARYRPLDPRLDYRGREWDARGYIHNGHLWIMLKSGLVGYSCLLWLSIAFLIRGFHSWRFVPNPQLRASVLGFPLTYLGVFVGAIVAPIFMEWFWTPVIGLMMGINEAAFRTAKVARKQSVTESSRQPGAQYGKQYS